MKKIYQIILSCAVHVAWVVLQEYALFSSKLGINFAEAIKVI